MRRLPVFMVLAVVVLSGACGGGGDGGGSGGAAGGDAVLEDAGVGSVELTGPDEDGAGKVPTFTWEEVEGAVQYRLFVLDAQGRPVWAWQGEGTEVALGGVPDRPAGEAGPVVTEGSTWSVVALDAEGQVVAASEDRPVSP